MSEIKVTFAGIDGARGNVMTAAGKLNTQLEELKRYLAPMVAQWDGQAATEYGVQQRKWDTAAAELTAVLSQIGVALGAANDGYQQVERANAGRWAG